MSCVSCLHHSGCFALTCLELSDWKDCSECPHLESLDDITLHLISVSGGWKRTAAETAALSLQSAVLRMFHSLCRKQKKESSDLSAEYDASMDNFRQDR